MTRRSKVHSSRPAVMGSHQRCWIWGRQPVLETLRAARWPILELHLDERLPATELDQAVRLAEPAGVEPAIASSPALTTLCRSAEHQGYVAKMPPFPYDGALDLLNRRTARPFYLLLDAIQDPFNFGAVLRSADAFHVDAVFVGKTEQADVNSLVARSSSGAVNHVRLAQVDDLPAWIGGLKQAGVRVFALSPGAKHDLSQADLRGPVAIVLGNEAAGIRHTVLNACDDRVSIRQFGHVGSLNAAVSAGIALYEVRRQRADAAT